MGLSVDVSEHRTHSVSRATGRACPPSPYGVEGMELAVEQIDRPHHLRVEHFPRGVYRVVEEGCRFANTLLTAASGTRRQQAETSGAHKEGTTVLAASCSRRQPHTGGQG